jgi:hypothetical protein
VALAVILLNGARRLRPQPLLRALESHPGLPAGLAWWFGTLSLPRRNLPEAESAGGDGPGARRGGLGAVVSAVGSPPHLPGTTATPAGMGSAPPGRPTRRPSPPRAS